MSIVFGFLNKNEKTGSDNDQLKDIFADLSLNGQRPLNTARYDSLVLSHMQFPEDKQRIVTNENGSVVLMLGGNIFDYKSKVKDLEARGHKFRDSGNAAEYILHSYEERGQAVFKDLNGIFSVVIWDKNNKRLMIANDTFGFHPLFIYDSEEAFLFCSEYQPILKYRKFKRDLNHIAIAEYFLVGATLRSKTFFKHINNLPPASILEITGDDTKLNNYDPLEIKIQRDKPIEFFAEQLDEKFKNAVRIRIGEYGVNGSDLSGGLDTRFILGCLPPEERARMEFSTGVGPYLDETKDKDAICSKILAEKLGLRHEITKKRKQDHVFNIRFFDDIRLKRSGHRWFVGTYGGLYLSGMHAKLLSRFAYHAEVSGQPDAALGKYFSKKFIKETDYLADICSYSQIDREGAATINRPLLAAMELDNRTFFYSKNLVAASGWVCPYSYLLDDRVMFPFNDIEFLKTLLTVPPEYLANYELYVRILKTYHSDMTAFPFSPTSCRHPGLHHLGTGKIPWKAGHENICGMYEEFIALSLKDPIEWCREKYGWFFYNRQRLKMQLLKYVGLKKLLDRELIKTLYFEAWFRRYCNE